MPRNSNNVYTFKRDAADTDFSVAGPSFPYLNAEQMTFNRIVNATEFQALFDAYKINCCVFHFMIRSNAAGISTPVYFPKLCVAWDYDDDTTPASINELKEYKTYREMVFDRSYSFKVYPAFASPVYLSAVSSSYRAMRGFLDMASIAVPHYGFKWGVYGAHPTSAEFSWSIRVTYYCTCKHQR